MKVFLYALSTCPWCRKTKQFLKDNKIAFDYVDYDLADEEKQEKIMEELSAMNATSGFPVAVIGKDVVIGYNPEKYAALLGLKKG
jgi:glutaredoxin